jgi:type III secretory pathway component EscR
VTNSASNPASNLQSNVGSTNNSGNANSANQSGADPFKAFLDKQKQQSKEAGVSPFGK